MNNIDKNSLARRFGKSQKTYENATPIQEKMAQHLMSKIDERVAKKEIFTILEIGCGSGRLTRQLVAKFPQAKIIAIDISAEMISAAKKSCPDVDFIVGDAEKYISQFKEKFDLIISNATFQWFENAEIVFNKCCEILAPQGQIAIATFGEQTFCELSASFNHAYKVDKIIMRNHVVPMLSRSDWQKINHNLEISEQIIKKNFADVPDFLHSLQKAGAVNSLASHAILRKNIYKNMCKYYLENYSDQKSGEIVATYHIFNIFYLKRASLTK